MDDEPYFLTKIAKLLNEAEKGTIRDVKNAGKDLDTLGDDYDNDLLSEDEEERTNKSRRRYKKDKLSFIKEKENVLFFLENPDPGAGHQTMISRRKSWRPSGSTSS